MRSFREALQKELVQSLSNNFGVENYDEHRFGKIPINPLPSINGSLSVIGSLKGIVKRIARYNANKNSTNKFLEKSFAKIKPYEQGLEDLYKNLDRDGRHLIVKLIAYRILGFRKVKLPRNNIKYWKALDRVKTLKDSKDTYDPHFMHFLLEKFDLNAIGYDMKLYLNDMGIAIEYFFEQYAYKSDKEKLVAVQNGDVVLDLGACWGDTALYFAFNAGENGKVYSFEFIPDNIQLFDINISLNPNLVNRIKLVSNPVSNVSGDTIYYKNNGPGSKVMLEPFEGQTGTTTTITVDDFVTKHSIAKVDFIKMDIEGAELLALQGAINTIKKYRPKLAITIYHSMEDFINIPKWIMDLNLGYELFIGHYTIHAEETVCFAKLKNL